MENKRQFKGFVANNDFFPQDKPTCASSQWFYNKQWIKYVVQVTWVFFSCNLRYHTEWILLLQIFCSKTTQAISGQPIQKIFFFFFEFSRLSLGDQPPAKMPEDSEYKMLFQHATEPGLSLKCQCNWFIYSWIRLVAMRMGLLIFWLTLGNIKSPSESNKLMLLKFNTLLIKRPNSTRSYGQSKMVK